MNVDEEQSNQMGYKLHFNSNQYYLKSVFGASELLLSYNTFQFEDYSKVVADRFDPEEKARSRRENFPVDYKKAFTMGAGFARK